jgi:hypothetical protein
MSKGIIIGLILLAGCFYDIDGRNVVVISADGTTEVGYCGYAYVAACTLQLCPDGNYTLKATDKFRGDAVIRCLPPMSAK